MSRRRVRAVIDEDESLEDDKTNQSLFLVTINSNKAITNPNDPYIQQFKALIKATLSNIEDYVAICPHSPPDPSMIISLRAKTEIGSKLHRIHCHASVEVRHSTRVRIDVQRLEKDLPGMYVQSLFVRGSAEFAKVQRYIGKQQ